MCMSNADSRQKFVNQRTLNEIVVYIRYYKNFNIYFDAIQLYKEVIVLSFNMMAIEI